MGKATLMFWISATATGAGGLRRKFRAVPERALLRRLAKKPWAVLTDIGMLHKIIRLVRRVFLTARGVAFSTGWPLNMPVRARPGTRHAAWQHNMVKA